MLYNIVLVSSIHQHESSTGDRYTYVPSLLNLHATSYPIPPLWVIAEYWFELPESHSKFSLAILHMFSSVQSLSCVQLFVTPRTSAHQTSLSITNSQSPFKPMSIESVIPSNHLILCPHFSVYVSMLLSPFVPTSPSPLPTPGHNSVLYICIFIPSLQISSIPSF